MGFYEISLEGFINFPRRLKIAFHLLVSRANREPRCRRLYWDEEIKYYFLGGKSNSWTPADSGRRPECDYPNRSTGLGVSA